MSELDARAHATARGLLYSREDLRSSGGTVPLREVCARLGVCSRDIDVLVADGSLLAVKDARGRRRFPAAQFRGDGYVVFGLADVQAALGFGSPWSVLNFLVNENDLLSNEWPINVLKRGDLEKVIQAATIQGAHGA